MVSGLKRWGAGGRHGGLNLAAGAGLRRRSGQVIAWLEQAAPQDDGMSCGGVN